MLLLLVVVLEVVVYPLGLVNLNLTVQWTGASVTWAQHVQPCSEVGQRVGQLVVKTFLPFGHEYPISSMSPEVPPSQPSPRRAHKPEDIRNKLKTCCTCRLRRLCSGKPDFTR